MTSFIICTFSILSFIVTEMTAQSADTFAKFKIIDLSFGIQATLMEIHPGPDGTAYGITANKGTIYSPSTMHAHKVDKDFNFVQDYKIENASYKYPFKSDSGAKFFIAGGKLKLIYFDDAKTALKIFVVDVENSSNPKELGQFKIEGRTKGAINSLIKSADDKNFAFILDVETVESKEIFILTFDESLVTTGEYKIEKKENMREQLFSINNQGTLCSFEIYHNGARKNEPVILTFAYELFSNGKSVKAHSIPDIDQEGTTAIMNTEGNNFLIDVLAHHDKDVQINSKSKSQTQYDLYHQILDAQLNFIVNSKQKMSDDKMEALKTSGKYKGAHVELKGTFLMEDGSSIVLADAHTTYGESTTTFNFKTGQTDVNKTQYSFTGIMTIHMSPEGEIKEVKLFDRVTTGVFYWYMPLVPLVINDGVCFTYFDNDKETHIIKLGIDSEGSLAVHENTWDQDAMEGRAIAQPTLVSDGHSNLYSLVDHPRKQINIIKISLNE